MADTHCTVPCNDCPFRRKSLPGWLGPWSVEEVLGHIAYGPFPCHKTISGPNMENDDPKLRQCAGAAIFMNNKLQMSRDPSLSATQKALKGCTADLKASVFSTADEFAGHHRRLGGGSKRDAHGG